MLGDARDLYNDYARGERQAVESLQAFDAKGIVPQQVAAGHAHAMGLKFDLMFRIGMTGGIPGGIHAADNYLNRHPEHSLVRRDGTPAWVASYAFPEVRKLMTDIIAEAMERFDADGANLCLIRGPHAPEYEVPVLEAFQKKYNEDARKVDPGDPRLRAVRSALITEFIRGVRRTLDGIGQSKNRTLELSIWIGDFPPAGEVFDVKAWLKEGLLNGIISNTMRGCDDEYRQLRKTPRCQFIQATGADPAGIISGYKLGADGFALWDIDSAQFKADTWDLLRRIGHPDDMGNWNQVARRTRSISIMRIDGRSLVGPGLMQSVYSGG
jgi:hypothetical protein